MSRETPERLTRMDILKWTIFTLFVGQLLKLQIETQPFSSLKNDIQAHETIELGSNSSSFYQNRFRHQFLETSRNNTGTISVTKEIGSATNGNSSKQQRIVILPGPHKSASTSIQIYLVQLHKENVLQSHNWAWVGKESSKGFASLAQQLLYPPAFNSKESSLLKYKSKTQQLWDDGKNLVIAAEFMDYVASLSEEEAQTSINRLTQWLPTYSDGSLPTVEAVIIYRTPRTSHLISAWKQQVQFHKASSSLPWRESLDDEKQSRRHFGKPPSLAEWLCNATYPQAMKYDIETILSAQLNPFGVAYTYKEYGGAEVTLVDMSGVPDGDVPNSIVCDVLGLPCIEGRLAIDTTVESVQRNHKEERVELRMSEGHLNEAEEIIRDMDCYYYCLLGDGVKIMHGRDKVFEDGKMSWETCCQRSKKKELEMNGKWMAQSLVELGCRAYEESLLHD